MKLTAKYLKQLIKESIREDMDFLRYMRYTATDELSRDELGKFNKILSNAKKQNNNIVLDYIPRERQLELTGISHKIVTDQLKLYLQKINKEGLEQGSRWASSRPGVLTRDIIFSIDTVKKYNIQNLEFVEETWDSIKKDLKDPSSEIGWLSDFLGVGRPIEFHGEDAKGYRAVEPHFRIYTSAVDPSEVTIVELDGEPYQKTL